MDKQKQHLAENLIGFCLSNLDIATNEKVTKLNFLYYFSVLKT